MLELKAILLTQGMHGMVSQVEGLAKALEIEFTHHKVELNNFWNLLPPKFTPVSQNVYKKIDHLDFDIIISCGRKSVIPSIHLKNISNKKVFNIHIQDPKVDLNHFDFVIHMKSLVLVYQLSYLYSYNLKYLFELLQLQLNLLRFHRMQKL